MGFLHFRLRFLSRFYVLSPGHFNNFQLISLRFVSFFFFFFVFLVANSWKCRFIDLLTLNFIFTANFPKKHFSIFIYLFICLLACVHYGQMNPNLGFVDGSLLDHKWKRRTMQFSMREKLLTLHKLFVRPRVFVFDFRSLTTCWLTKHSFKLKVSNKMEVLYWKNCLTLY